MGRSEQTPARRSRESMRGSEPSPAGRAPHRGPSAPVAPERIHTPRMVGERLRLDHEDELVRLLLDPRVAPTMWSAHEVRTSAAVHSGLLSKLSHWSRHGFGQWFLRDRESGAMLGRGGPQYTSVSGRDEVEIGWVIVPERWGQGLATELALASLDVAFGPLERHDVIAYTQPDNIASRRVMEKTGFDFERDILVDGKPYVLYRRSAPGTQPAGFRPGRC